MNIPKGRGLLKPAGLIALTLFSLWIAAKATVRRAGKSAELATFMPHG